MSGRCSRASNRFDVKRDGSGVGSYVPAIPQQGAGDQDLGRRFGRGRDEEKKGEGPHEDEAYCDVSPATGVRTR